MSTSRQSPEEPDNFVEDNTGEGFSFLMKRVRPFAKRKLVSMLNAPSAQPICFGAASVGKTLCLKSFYPEPILPEYLRPIYLQPAVGIDRFFNFQSATVQAVANHYGIPVTCLTRQIYSLWGDK